MQSALSINQDQRLSDHKFVDLYISPGQIDRFTVRGLSKPSDDDISPASDVTALPHELLSDAEKLYEELLREWYQDGYHHEFPLTYDGTRYRCAMIARPGLTGTSVASENLYKDVSWCLRRIENQVPSFSQLKTPSVAIEDIQLLLRQKGLVLVSGHFGSGKTLLASSIFDFWVSQSGDIGITLEDPPELRLDDRGEGEGRVFQVDLRNDSMKDAIKSARRWAPKYVYVGEVRDEMTAAEMLSIAQSGPLVICTIHAETSIQAITSLFRFSSNIMSEGSAREMIASSLRHIFHTEIRNGIPRVESVRLHGSEAALIRSKIRTGSFHALSEDFSRQKTNRGK